MSQVAGRYHDGEGPHSEAVLDSLTDHIAILDDSGMIVSVNRPWREFAAANAAVGADVCEGAGYLPVCDEAQGHGAETARTVAQGIRDVLADRRAKFSCEYSCHAPDRRRWFLVRVTRLVRDGCSGVVLSHQDITERKLAEEALGRGESRLRVVMDHIQAAIFLKDLEGRYLMVNRRFADNFGVSEEQIVGKTDDDFFPADLADTYRRNDRKALNARVPIEVEEVALYADGPHTSIVIKAPCSTPTARPGPSAESPPTSRNESGPRRPCAKARSGCAWPWKPRGWGRGTGTSPRTS